MRLAEPALRNHVAVPPRHELVVDEATSRRLGRIRQHATSPELLVRRMITDLGLRFRSRNRDLPGSPDLANRSGRWAVFVHGCYWHAHHRCVRATVPKRNRAFWQAKFAANRARDARAISELRRLGYRTVVIWECELSRRSTVQSRLRRQLVSD